MTKLHQISKRKLLYSSIISIIFVLSMVTSVGLFATQNSTNTNPTSTIKSAVSPPAINESWTGVGNNQTVRSYLEQDSNSTGDTNNFSISVPTSPSQINSGNMNFTFNQNITANYTFDQNLPLSNPSSKVSSRSNPYFNLLNPTDNCFIESGNSTLDHIEGLDNIIDSGSGSAGTAYPISSYGNIINFTYTANFTSTTYVRNNTIGIQYNILKTITSSENVSMSLFAYNYYNQSWDLLKYYPVWNSTSSTTKPNIFITVPNTNCAYFNSSSMTRVKLELNSSAQFTLNIYNFSVSALNGYDVKINNNNWAGTEFDLKGNATVYGFYAYIRTLTNETQNYNLNVSLYRANQTATIYNITYPTKTVMKPDTAKMIYSYNFTGYSKDGYAFIPFIKDNSTGINLNVSNYFVVLSTTANSTNSPYSILCIPYGLYNPIDNLFLTSQDSGNTWAKQFYNYNQYEASPFAINLLRPVIPSDLNMSIDNQTISSRSISSGIYSNTSPYEWGLGQWNHIYQSTVKDVNKIITIALNWNTTITQMLNFNVVYNITVFSIENAISSFNLALGQNPIWYLNYTFNQSLYSPWIFQNFSFVVPSDWYCNSILGPDDKSIALTNVTRSYASTGTDNNYFTLSYAKTIKYSGNGFYQLNCSSFNYIDNMTSYLHYNNDTWETRGFMPGDNISTAVQLLNYTDYNSIINSGNASCFLYDPSNNSVSGAYLTDSTPETNETYNPGTGNILLTIYNFGGRNILNTTTSTPLGEYSLVYQWTDGNEVGYDRLPIYISDYQANITKIYVDNSSKTNVLLGLINNDYTNLQQYNTTIFAINQTQGTTSSSIPYVNDTLGKEYNDYMVNITSLTMNESVINLGETIKLNINVASYDDFASSSVKLGVQFVQSCNEKWIVMQKNSTQLALTKTGTPNDTRVFQFTFQVPSNFTGVNAPIRLNPLKIRITPWINGINMSSFDVNDYFPLVNFSKSQFEGNVMGFTILGDHTGKSLVIENNRTYSVLPGNTTYLIQVCDNNYVSTQNDVVRSFYSNLISEVTNVTSPNTIVWGKSYELTGYLQDEFGNPIANKNVDIQYLFNNSLYNYDQLNGTNMVETNSNGYFSGIFNSTVVPKNSNITVCTSWKGDSTHFSTNTNTTLQMNTYKNQVQITIINSTMYPSLYKGQGFEFVYQITNTGNSTLNNMHFSLGFPNTTITSEDLNASMVKQLLPGRSMTVGFYAEIPVVYPGDNVNITLYVNGTTVQSSEYMNSSKTYNFNLYDQNLFENWKEGLVIVALLGIIVLFIATAWYIVKTRRKLQEVPELPSRTIKRGRYVKVSELQKVKPEEEQKEIEKVEEKKEQKSADLDELLKEEGLDKDKSE